MMSYFIADTVLNLRCCNHQHICQRCSCIAHFTHYSSTIASLTSGVCRTGSKRQPRPRKPSVAAGSGENPSMKRSPSTLSTTSNTSGYRPRSSPAGLYSYTGGMCNIFFSQQTADCCLLCCNAEVALLSFSQDNDIFKV